MKNQLLVLSGLSLAVLCSQELFSANFFSRHKQVVEEESSYDSCTYMDDCCCDCCVPEPKKCIDCECYTPKYYDLQCDWGTFFDIEFLYWYGKETNLAYALVVGNTNNFTRGGGLIPRMFL